MNLKQLMGKINSEWIFQFFLYVGCFVCVGFIWVNAWTFCSSPPFSPDSWSYYDIALTFRHDFYHVTTLREFTTEGINATAFPPLFPAMIFWVNMIFSLGIYSGYFLNHFLMLLTLMILYPIYKKILCGETLSAKVAALLTWITLIQNPYQEWERID